MAVPLARRALISACAGAVLLVPAAAHGAVTTSQITTPADPTFLIYDDDVLAANQQITVSGTTNGAGGDLIDIICVYGDSSDSFASNVAVAADGSFSVTATYSPLSGNEAPCRLRAVRDGLNSGDDLFDFKGPRVAVTEVDLGTTIPVTGSGTPVVNDFDVEFTGFRASGQLSSFSHNGLEDHYSMTPSFEEAQYASWYLAAEMDRLNYDGERNSIQIDGKNAWGGDDVPQFDYDGGGPEPSSAPAGFTGATTAVSHNASNGDLTVVETAPLFRCTDDSLPVTAGKCPTAVPTGVTLRRTTTVTNEGSRVRVADAFVSTDGAAHTARLEHYNETDDSDYPTWRFPTDADFGFFDEGDFVTDQPAPGTVQWVDGDPGSSPGGAMTWLEPVDYFRFADYDYLLSVRTVAVPAGGESPATTIYTAGRQQAVITGDASAVEDAAGLPVLTVTGPGNGAVVGTPTVVVSGTARDNKGITALTVNGVPTALNGESFAATVPLAPGPNTIPVAAADAAGNVASAAIVVTYVVPTPPAVTPPGVTPPVKRCIAPKIKAGSTQKTVKAALVKANCKAGKKVVLKTSKTVKKGRVISISRKAGTRLPAGTAIKINVSKGKPAVKKRKRR
jgi:hypothetical protein